MAGALAYATGYGRLDWNYTCRKPACPNGCKRHGRAVGKWDVLFGNRGSDGVFRTGGLIFCNPECAKAAFPGTPFISEVIKK